MDVAPWCGKWDGIDVDGIVNGTDDNASQPLLNKYSNQQLVVDFHFNIKPASLKATVV